MHGQQNIKISGMCS